MTTITETEIVRACQTLFGEHVDISRDFLYYVQPSGVKSAYRKKAKENHPDLFAAHPPYIQQKQTALFREILRAYDVLTLFFKQREKGAWNPGPRTPRPRRRNPGDGKAWPSTGTASSRTGDDTYYRGNVPLRTLQIGQYLYYQGKISFGELIKALVWQRKQRPSFGDIAQQWGFLDADGVDRIFKACDRPRLSGERAVELGLLTIFQVNIILLYQRSQQDRLGKYFVLNKILTAGQLDRLARECKEHNAAVLANSIRTKHRHPQAHARGA